MKSKRLEAVVTAGNALADSLAQVLGPDFAELYPPRADARDVRRKLVDKYGGTVDRIGHSGGPLFADMWQTWAAIQNAKHLLGDPEARAKFEASRVKCNGCRGTGKVPEDNNPRNKREVICGTCMGRGFNVTTPNT